MATHTTLTTTTLKQEPGNASTHIEHSIVTDFDPVVGDHQLRQSRLVCMMKHLIDSGNELLCATLPPTEPGAFGDWTTSIPRKERWSQVSTLVKNGGWKHIGNRQQKKDIWIPVIQARFRDMGVGSSPTLFTCTIHVAKGMCRIFPLLCKPERLASSALYGTALRVVGSHSDNTL